MGAVSVGLGSVEAGGLPSVVILGNYPAPPQSFSAGHVLPVDGEVKAAAAAQADHAGV